MAKTPKRTKSPAPKSTPEQKARSEALKAKFKASSAAGTVAQQKEKKVADAKSKAAPVWQKLDAALAASKGKKRSRSEDEPTAKPSPAKKAKQASPARTASPKQKKKPAPKMSPAEWKDKVFFISPSLFMQKCNAVSLGWCVLLQVAKMRPKEILAELKGRGAPAPAGSRSGQLFSQLVALGP